MFTAAVYIHGMHGSHLIGPQFPQTRLYAVDRYSTQVFVDMYVYIGMYAETVD